MQTQTEKAIIDIARELREIRKLLAEQIKIEKFKAGIATASSLNKPWAPFESIGNDRADYMDCLSNNPEAHGWCQDEQG